MHCAAVTSMLVAATSVGAPPAGAHGPCACVSPNPARAGMQVRIDGPAVRVIWNPGPHDFAGQTTPLDLASAHVAGAPSATVMRHRRPQWPRRAPSGRRFTVPEDTPAGLFFVLIHDGSEGGAHTTWDYVQVAGRPPPTGGLFAPLLATFRRLQPVLLSLGAGARGAAGERHEQHRRRGAVRARGRSVIVALTRLSLRT